jgi:hypothetical protein
MIIPKKIICGERYGGPIAWKPLFLTLASCYKRLFKAKLWLYYWDKVNSMD